MWMEDPVVVTPSGISYDRVHLERWMAASHTDPCTRAPLTRENVVSNLALKAAIEMYRPTYERYELSGVLPL